MTKLSSKKIAVFGAAPDTGNLGVTALSQSIVSGLWGRGYRDITVFDHGRGRRAMSQQIGPAQIHHHVQGAVSGYRLYRSENLTRAVAENRLPWTANPIVRTVKGAAAILDISGGDSFSDIYGQRRFVTVTQPKHLALDAGVPLVLMPQTYGPFEDKARRSEAAEILRRAVLAFARDARSHAAMTELLGPNYDAKKHLSGVDVAFALPVSAPSSRRRARFEAWKSRQPGRIVGFNVSGLLFNKPGDAQRKFRLHLDYRSLSLAFLERLLAESEASVLLVPHVLDRPGSRESDEQAVRAVMAGLSSRYGDRLHAADMSSCACEAKWFVSQCHWLAGARMHATIAALSTGVPALAMAYSGKMEGVFETCGQGHSVLDLRLPATEASTVDFMMASLSDAPENRISLAAALPYTLAKARRQFDLIASRLAPATEASVINEGEADAA